MKFNYTPLGTRVVITQDKPEEKTASGLYIPDSAQEKPNRGTVIAVADKSELKVGDKVIYAKFTGKEVEVDKVTYVLLKEDDILLVEG